ncbi:MAG: PEP-CTERM sorting domain-containing protein [Phycisphaerae bacterium]|nr:PEP-CTERM sorting domain-containing protein [Phycisphaerae bacterium]
MSLNGGAIILIPEPTTLALVMVGGGLLMRARSKR